MKHLLKASLCALAIASAPFTLSAEAAARPMTETDLATIKRVGAPAVSPNGNWLAYQVTSTDPESYERTTQIYLQRVDGNNAEPVLVADHDGADEHSPAFSPGGTALYYLSDRSGSEQLWMILLNDDGIEGEPVQASALDADIAGYTLSPDGRAVAIFGDIAKNCPTFGCEDDGNTADDGFGTGREYDELFVRHWSSWETPGNYSRVFTFGLDDGKLVGNGAAMDGDLVGDSPSKPFGGGEEIAWDAKGLNVYFTLRKADGDEPKSTDLDIYSSRIDGMEAPRNLTQANEATDSLPAPSPGGKYLAWAAMERPGYESDRMVLMLREQGSEVTRALTKDWDRSVGSIAWAPDGKSVIVTAQDVLDHPAFRVDVETGKVTRLTGEGNVGSVIPLTDGSIVYTMNSIQAPNEIFRRDAKGKVTQLTDVNGAVLAEIDPVTIERFSFAGAEGDTVWGQIIKPTGSATKGRDDKMPVAFLVHGGPQGSFGNSWSFRWNPKVMASQGYAAVTVDFHGSVGYGQEFTESINQDWGGKPLTDLKLGLAAAGKEDSAIDITNACALGASYGGYMMNWISGNWNDGFKCIVNHAGIFDLRSFAYSTEELWFDQWDHGGPWWSRPNAEKWNPVNHVDNWKTPTLVIHGEKDFRIPYTQSLMPFTVLQEKGIDSKLLIFPDENHWINKPKNSIQWHRNVFGWLDKYIGDGEEAE